MTCKLVHAKVQSPELNPAIYSTKVHPCLPIKEQTARQSIFLHIQVPSGSQTKGLEQLRLKTESKTGERLSLPSHAVRGCEACALHLCETLKPHLGCIHYVCYRGGRGFFSAARFFYIPPKVHKIFIIPQAISQKMTTPLLPEKKYQNKYLNNSTLYMFEISRDSHV